MAHHTGVLDGLLGGRAGWPVWATARGSSLTLYDLAKDTQGSGILQVIQFSS
jgi:hypothetical protein